MAESFRYDTSVFVADTIPPPLCWLPARLTQVSRLPAADHRGGGGTNCFGTVYFARYFELQGRAREAFFRSVVPNFPELMDAGYRLLTVEATMRYARELRLADALTIELQVEELHPTSVVLRFAFLRSQTEPVGLGQQRLVLTNRDGRPVKIPKDIR